MNQQSTSQDSSSLFNSIGDPADDAQVIKELRRENEIQKKKLKKAEDEILELEVDLVAYDQKLEKKSSKLQTARTELEEVKTDLIDYQTRCATQDALVRDLQFRLTSAINKVREGKTKAKEETDTLLEILIGPDARESQQD